MAVKKQLKHEYIDVLSGIIEIMHVYPEFAGVIRWGKQQRQQQQKTVEDSNGNRSVRTEAFPHLNALIASISTSCVHRFMFNAW